jgi:hypothetical protein
LALVLQEQAAAFAFAEAGQQRQAAAGQLGEQRAVPLRSDDSVDLAAEAVLRSGPEEVLRGVAAAVAVGRPAREQQVAEHPARREHFLLQG